MGFELGTFQFLLQHINSLGHSPLISASKGKSRQTSNHYKRVDFNAGKTQLVSIDQSNNTGAIDVKMDGYVLQEKPSFKMLGLTFSSKLNWGFSIIFIAKTASKKIGVLIHS